jgi:prophage antirepressor-like protein
MGIPRSALPSPDQLPEILMNHRSLMTMDRHLAPCSANSKPASSLFHFNHNAIRTTVDHQGNPWFVAINVCAALDIKNNRDALAKLDPDEKGVVTADTLGGVQSFTTVNEAGLYELIFRSRKAEPKDFKRWVKHSVLPALGKDGLYVQGEETLFAECVTDGDLDKALELAQARVADLFNAKAQSKNAEHQEEKEARYIALRKLSRGRVRSRKGPK